jgi:hypothetical protein
MVGGLDDDLLLLLSAGELWLLLACPSPPGLALGTYPSPPCQLLVACPSPPGQGLLHLAFFFHSRDSIHGWIVRWCGGAVRTCVLLVSLVLVEWLVCFSLNRALPPAA